MRELVLVCAIYIFSTSWATGSIVSVEDYINLINSRQSSWRAGKYSPGNTTIKTLPHQGVDFVWKPELYLERKSCGLGSFTVPESFDARTQWPVCKDIIGKIGRQGLSEDCWAFATTEVMSDRLCIQSNGKVKFEFSAQDLVSCCKNCSNDKGGFTDIAFRYWIESGIVSGGGFTSNKGCKPFQEPEYYYNLKSPCNESCYTAGYDISYKEDKHYGSKYYFVNTQQECIQIEIMEKGPVAANLRIYEDFYFYKDGVYVHVVGEYTGMHSVKIVGWGIEKGLSYWLVANTWGCEWGSLDGFFKIRRGENECGIEETVIAGNPRLDPSQIASNNSYIVGLIVSGPCIFIAISLVVCVLCRKQKIKTAAINYSRINN